MAMVHLPLQPFDSRPETFDDVPDMSYLVEFRFELVNLSDDGVETNDFRVGGSHRSAGARGLVDGRHLGLRCKLEKQVTISLGSACIALSNQRERKRDQIEVGKGARMPTTP